MSPSPDSSAPALSAEATSMDRARWFAAEVQRHDGQLKAYLRTTYPDVHDVEDIVQESYLRVWKARTFREIRSAKAFLFTVAQRLSLDFLRKQRNSPVDALEDIARLSVITDEHDAADVASLQEKIRLLAEAMVTLSPRSREVVMLCKIERRKRKDVAAQLGISESTVDEYLARGLAKLEEFMRAKGVDGIFGK